MTRLIVLDTEERKLRALAILRATPVQEPAYAMRIELYKHTRSDEQNRHYWAMLDDIAEYANPEGKYYGREIWHEYFKRLYLPIQTVAFPLGSYTKQTSTTTLNTKQFAEYMERIIAWCAEHDVQLGAGDA